MMNSFRLITNIVNMNLISYFCFIIFCFLYSITFIWSIQFLFSYCSNWISCDSRK